MHRYTGRWPCTGILAGSPALVYWQVALGAMVYQQKPQFQDLSLRSEPGTVATQQYCKTRHIAMHHLVEIAVATIQTMSKLHLLHSPLPSHLGASRLSWCYSTITE